MKFPKIEVAIIFLVMIATKINAQQSPVLTDYYYNSLILNPAYSGYYENSNLIFSGRIQTGGVDGAPETLTFSFDTPISQKKMGVGGIITHDKIGVSTKTGAYATYAFKLFSFNDNSNWHYSPETLSLGLVAGVSSYKQDLLSLNMSDDPVFQQNVNETIPSIGAGIFYNSKSFYIGLSSPNLLEATLSDENNMNIKTNYYLNSGARIYTSRFFFIEPNILLKYNEGVALQADFNLICNYENKFEFGAGYKTTSQLNALVGLHLNRNFLIVYNFNPSLSSNPLGQSHGILLNYRFGE